MRTYSKTYPDVAPGTSSTVVQGDSGQVFSVKQAAVILGVSVNTVRRWIREGRLETERQPRPQGYVLLVRLPSRAPVDEVFGDEQVSDRTPHQQVPNEQVIVAPDLSRAEAMANYNRALVEPLVSELAETRRRLEVLAGDNGRLAAELAQARERILMLQAPKEEPAAVEPTQAVEAVPAPTVRPWWRFWG